MKSQNEQNCSSFIIKAKQFLLKAKSHIVPWYVVFYAVVAYYSTVLNIQILEHFYRILDDLKEDDLIFRCTPVLVLFSALSIVFLAFSFKYIFKIILPILILVGSIIGHYAYNYGIIFDYDMMINMFSTNLSETKSYLGWDVALDVFLYGVIPALAVIFVKIRWPKNFIYGTLQRLAVFSIAVLTLVGISSQYYKNYASICRNNNILRKEISPYNFVWFGYKAFYTLYLEKPMKFSKYATDSIIDNPEERPELVVVVLGETARAQNFKHNGYDRDTTPYTNGIENFTKFSPVTSCGTATAISVPCMFSIMNRDNYNEKKAYHSSSVADILKYAGYKVMWYDNDGGCKGVCDRIPNESMLPALPDNKGFCDGDTCYDTILVKKLIPRILRN